MASVSQRLSRLWRPCSIMNSDSWTKELIDVVVALAAWAMPDLGVPTKVAISLVLFSIWAITKLKPKFIVNDFSPWVYLTVVIAPICISTLSWWIASFINAPISVTHNESLQFGLATGVLIGLPLALFAANKVTHDYLLICGFGGIQILSALIVWYGISILLEPSILKSADVPGIQQIAGYTNNVIIDTVARLPTGRC
ncbi:hypothetical protein ANRL2_04005 [Anaerolineae bacterium]|nr:hypothetical protein ANRL2_04005 [Anaerolineae bacterium]